MAAAAAALQEVHDVLQVCNIYKRVSITGLIDNKGFNSIKDFGVMDGDTDVLEMPNYIASGSVATCVNLGTVQIKGLQNIFWWIHDHQTHNQPLIADDFGQGLQKDGDYGETDREGEGRDRCKYTWSR